MLRKANLVRLSLLSLAMLGSQPAQAGWSGWQSLGGEIKGRPTLTSATIGGQKSLFVAARGKDDAMWWRVKVGTKDWTPWKSAGGILTSPPDCVGRTKGVVDCFVRGKDKTLAQRSYVNGVWNGWSTPGGSQTFESGPSVSAASADDLGVFVFAEGTIRALRWQQGSSWSQWIALNGTSAPLGQITCSMLETGIGETISTGNWFTTGESKTIQNTHVFCLHREPLKSALRFYATTVNNAKMSEMAGAEPTMFEPEMRVIWTQQGYVGLVSVVSKSDGALRQGKYLFGKGWIQPFESAGGQLSSAPSCTLQECAARGMDGALWIVSKG